MKISGPSLHPPVLTSPEHQAAVAAQLKSIASARLAAAAKASAAAPAPSTAPTIAIPLTTISRVNNFDALIKINFAGATPNASPCLWDDVGTTGNPAPCLIVDSGNSTLIVPDYDCIATTPDIAKNYQVLVDDIYEPFGCPAKIVRGPIQVPTLAATGEYHQINNCIFYACTGVNADNERTANFGLGWISPWRDTKNTTVPAVQSPLTYNADYPYVEIKYADADAVVQAADQPKAVGGSWLIISRHGTAPQNYSVFDIVRGVFWMALRPQALKIGDVGTTWPGDPAAIAMIDTGGGPVFLSDPNNLLLSTDWPDPAPLPPPSWLLGTFSCQATGAALASRWLTTTRRLRRIHFPIRSTRQTIRDKTW